MTLVAVADTLSGRSLDELAAIANREHAEVERSLNDALVHAIRAGEALLAARAMVSPGTWLLWLEANFPKSHDMASRYMRVAAYQEQLDPEMDVKAAIASIAGLDPVSSTSTRRLDEALVDEAKRLIADGWVVKAAAEHVGISPSALRYWTNPKARKRDAESKRRYRQRQRAARHALAAQEREREIKRAVRKAGAATQELYAMAERMQDVLAQAHRETTDSEARAALSLAGEHYRKMRDEIVRALGVSA